MPDGAGSAQRIVVVEDDESAALLAAHPRRRRLRGRPDRQLAPPWSTSCSTAGSPTSSCSTSRCPDSTASSCSSEIVKTGVPVLVLTADDTPTTRRRALGLGARDFVTKPLDRVEVLLRVGNLLQTRRLQRALEDRNHDLQRWVRARDRRPRGRPQGDARAPRAGRRVPRRRHLSSTPSASAAPPRCSPASSASPPTPIEHLRYAAPLHDVGKIGIPDAVWLKPGKLTDHERRMLEEHTEIGGRILSGSRSPILRLAEQIARTHHERWDGTGYPHGLAGDAIPLAGPHHRRRRRLRRPRPPAPAQEGVAARAGRRRRSSTRPGASSTPRSSPPSAAWTAARCSSRSTSSCAAPPSASAALTYSGAGLLVQYASSRSYARADDELGGSGGGDGRDQERDLGAHAAECGQARPGDRVHPVKWLRGMAVDAFTAPFSTHEVTNQVPPLQDLDLFSTNVPLVEALEREGAGWAREQCAEVGRAWGGDPLRWGFAGEREPAEAPHARPLRQPHRRGRVPPGLPPADGARLRRRGCTRCRGRPGARARTRRARRWG